MVRILFVDDEPRILAALRDSMRRNRQRWDMVFVSSGDAAIEAISASPFDVVVSDMRMPGMDGATLLRHVKRKTPEATRIILSGYSDSQAAVRAVSVAHQCLAKPCDTNTLENVIQRVCNLRVLIADEQLRRIVGRIDTLPSLPGIYPRLVRILDDPWVGTSTIAELLETDMAMSAKVLQVVNSAFFGLSRRVTSIQDGVDYLGVDLIRTLAISASIFNGLSAVSTRKLITAIENHALQTANLARSICTKETTQDADDAFIAGLLHDIGVLIMITGVPRYFETLQVSLRGRPREPHEAELELWGVNHARVGAYLLGFWGLPFRVVEAVAYHHDLEAVPRHSFDLATVVYVANQLAHEVDAPWCLQPGALFPPLNTRYLDACGVLNSLPEWRQMALQMSTPDGRAA